MKITVIGTGYVGLVTGTCLAEAGNDVLCIDIDKVKVAKMQNGEVPIYEPHLETYFERNIKSGRLHFSTNIEEGVHHGEVIFLALPTPEDEDGSADLSYVLGVANQIGELMKDYKIIVSKSTVPVGTGERVKAALKAKTDVSFDVVSNPEFLREGFAVEDFMKPDRIVVGLESERAKNAMEKLYATFVRTGNPIVFMDIKSAELTKYAANAFLATKITYMNEIANYCEKVGANVDDVRMGMGLDERIGKRFLFPGIGYGGSCFPKDVKALHKSGKDAAHNFAILDSVIEVNEQQKTVLFPKMEAHFKGDLRGKKIALWGLAFKPDTDDIREAPALYMIEKLLAAGAAVTAFDPEAMDNVKAKLGDSISFASNMIGCC
jgi:UDPglucose 6-dehydrogenase